MMIERYNATSKQTIPPGRHTIRVDTTIGKPGGPGTVVINVDGAELARLDIPRTVPLAFTASETFDVGEDLGSPVSRFYFDRRPFAFNGQIRSVSVQIK